MAAKKKKRSKVVKRASGTAAAKRGTQRPSRAAPAAAPKRTEKASVSKKTASKQKAPAPAVAKRSPSTGASRKKTAPAEAAAAAPALAVGEPAPSFELQDQEGNTVSSSELAGHPYVLYFYPKDDTPGCTTEACGFRDALPEFDRIDVRVLGVSPDSVASHQRFVGKYGLTFTLLSDPEQKLASAYGVWSMKKNYGREYMGIVRSTFLIDAEGIVRKAWRGVRVNGHIAEVQAAAAQLA